MTKILVVYDERDIRSLLVDTLCDAGRDVIEAEDGSAALEKAYDEHPEFNLLDVMMPVMDGFQALARLKNNSATRPTPVHYGDCQGTRARPTQGDGLRWTRLHIEGLGSR